MIEDLTGVGLDCADGLVAGAGLLAIEAGLVAGAGLVAVDTTFFGVGCDGRDIKAPCICLLDMPYPLTGPPPGYIFLLAFILYLFV